MSEEYHNDRRHQEPLLYLQINYFKNRVLSKCTIMAIVSILRARALLRENK